VLGWLLVPSAGIWVVLDAAGFFGLREFCFWNIDINRLPKKVLTLDARQFIFHECRFCSGLPEAFRTAQDEVMNCGLSGYWRASVSDLGARRALNLADETVFQELLIFDQQKV
jgi:hypothetical protein